MTKYVIRHAVTVAAILTAQFAVTFGLRDTWATPSGIVALLAIRASGKFAQLQIDREVSK